MLIGENTVITLSYQLFHQGADGQSDGVLVDERPVNDPVEFLFGTKALLPALEEHIQRQSSGFKSSLTLDSGKAFGAYDEKLAVWYDRDKLPVKDLQLGMKFQTQGPYGDLISVMVRDIKEDKVLIDGNHPLAGLCVQFELTVLSVRAATEKEIATQSVGHEFH